MIFFFLNEECFCNNYKLIASIINYIWNDLFVWVLAAIDSLFKEVRVLKMGVARGLLHKLPLQFQHAEMFVSKVGNPCPTLGQLLASRILYTILVGEKQYEIGGARFCTQSCSKVGQLLVDSSPTPHPMGRCRGLPCSSLLSTPEIVSVSFAKVRQA